VGCEIRHGAQGIESYETSETGIFSRQQTAGSPSTGSGLSAGSFYGTQIYTDIYLDNCGLIAA